MWEKVGGPTRGLITKVIFFGVNRAKLVDFKNKYTLKTACVKVRGNVTVKSTETSCEKCADDWLFAGKGRIEYVFIRSFGI